MSVLIDQLRADALAARRMARGGVDEATAKALLGSAMALENQAHDLERAERNRQASERTG
jgi:hypothetical protein